MCFSLPNRLLFDFVLLTGVCVFAAGCGGGGGDSKGVAISGTVTLDGVPLDHGTILLKWPGNGAGAEITNGKFAIPAKVGPVPGKHRVEISSLEGGNKVTSTDPTQAMNEANGPPPTERIPTKYNTESGLTAEVKDGGESFSFELKIAAK
ncbi:MAG: hypothetical protein IAG10_17175 [Planctomycetaceae bacterium]|nr:hypothetical protein [Planctomycetaceae bacterium]